MMRKAEKKTGFLNIRNLLKNNRANSAIFFWVVATVLFIAPFCLWWLYVNAKTIFLGFQVFDYNGEFTYGFNNFKYIFSELGRDGSELLIGVKNTFKFWLWDFVVIFPLTYLTSIFLYKKVLGYKVFKFIFFLPAVISPVILTSFFKFAFQDGGPFMLLASQIAGRDIYVFQNSDTAVGALMAFNTWTFGTHFVLWVASFSRIPQEVLEYAKLDGVKWWQEMLFIIFPLTTSFFFLQVFMKVLGLFSAGAPILLLTQGAYNTMTISYWQFIHTLDNDISQARVAALGIMMTAISAPLSMIVRKITSKIETVEY